MSEELKLETSVVEEDIMDGKKIDKIKTEINTMDNVSNEINSAVEANSGKVTLNKLLTYRNYAIILLANFISRFGDSLDSIAYGWMVYQLTGSKLLLGTIFAINSLPNIIFGPFAGVIVDRHNKKRVILIVYIGRGVIVTLTALLYLIGVIRPWHLFVFTIINSTLETLGAPAFISILPKVLPKELFLKGNSFSTSAYKFAELVGLGIAGAIIALLGIGGAILIDGGTFFIAAVIILFLKLKHEDNHVSEISIKSYFKDLGEGFLFIKKSYVIKTTIILFAITNFCLAPINVLMPAYVEDILRSDASMLSMLGVALSVGIIIGGLLIGFIGNRVKKSWFISIGIFAFGINYCLLFAPGNLIPSGVISNALSVGVFFIFGFIVPMLTSPLTTNIMINTDNKMLGRVGSFISVISCCAIPLGSAITGSVSELFPMTSIFGVMGLIISLVGIRMFFNSKFKKFAD